MPQPKPIALFLSLAIIIAFAGCSPAANGTPPFDGDRAFGLLKQQVEIGPRYPGSPGHPKMIEFLQSQLKAHADGVRVREFSAKAGGKTLDMANVIAHINPDAKKWVLLAAHWDTRPTADMEIDPAKRKMPIPGANDGASGVAVLLELARMFAKQRPDVGVFFVFFDGEDYGPGADAMFMGAKHFADNLDSDAIVNGKRVDFKYGILLDMVGDKNLKIYHEQNSVDAAPDVVDKVWKAAAAIGYGDVFVPQVKHAISDDHVPLIRAGIKCIDVIDFDYASWHTLDDTVDKCSSDSLRKVGEVIARVIYQEKGS